MQAEFVRRSLGQGDLRPKDGKHLKWNVDHLLQRPCVELVAAYVIRCHDRIEGDLGRLLLNDPVTVAFAPGLGAADYEGSTHLLRVDADEHWWNELPSRIYHEFRTFL
jgi:Uri superfamily endonuclease